MDIVGEIDGWKILSDHESAFVRSFLAEPMAPVEVEYRNDVVERGVRGDATYLTHVLHANLRHQWDEEKKEWWSSGSLVIAIVNPQTRRPYRTGWKADTIWPNRVEEGIDRSVQDTILAPLLDGTKPRTTLTVIES